MAKLANVAFFTPIYVEGEESTTTISATANGGNNRLCGMFDGVGQGRGGAGRNHPMVAVYGGYFIGCEFSQTVNKTNSRKLGKDQDFVFISSWS